MSIARTLYEPEHEAFRESFAAFLDEFEPRFPEWEEAGIVPREVYREAGRRGFVAFAAPEQHGGAGVDDFRFNAILDEEAFGRLSSGFAGGISLINDVCLPYFTAYASEEQRERWLPGIAAGELVVAIAMTEPGTGSDLASIATRAEPVDGGWRVNGSKTFVTNGINADLVITVVRTDAGLSLVVVERGMDGFERGRNLEKLGWHAQDTAELFLTDVHVPAANLLGEDGSGFAYLVANLPQERLSIAVGALASAQAAFDTTLAYVKERKAFGRPVGSFQASRFALAELRTELDVAQVFVDRCIELLVRGELSVEAAAMAKWWVTELQGRVMDRCVQLHGGYGYMLEYPVARAFVDARVTRIFGGTNEIMKEIVGRSLGL